MTRHSALGGGFRDLAIDSQAVFRALLGAMAEPGTLAALAGHCSPPAPLGAAAGAIILAMADHDTPVYLDAAAAAGDAGNWIRFHTGADVVDQPADAVFAVLAAAGDWNLPAFAIGSAEYPDRSATLIVQVESVTSGEHVIVAGPGVPKPRRIAPHPMPEGWLESWNANTALFPQGCDLFLATPDTAIALPRTVHVARAMG